MSDDLTHQLARADDGRTLCFAEWGDPDGFPVMALHGTPGGRLNRSPFQDRVVEAGARVITYDRPGYGGSDRMRGRAIVDCVPDVRAIADQLGLDRFALNGGSGGGPHCLAVAARLGDRVVRTRCDVSVAPYGLDDLDFLAGMDPSNITEFGWALAGEEVLAPELTRELAAMAARVAEDPAKIFGDEWQLDVADREILAMAELATVIRESMDDLVRGGVWGWVDDDLAFLSPWGFGLAEISGEVQVRYGAKDVIVPATHGAWLGGHVPGAQVVVLEESGHMSDPHRIVEDLRWLISGV